MPFSWGNPVATRFSQFELAISKSTYWISTELFGNSTHCKCVTKIFENIIGNPTLDYPCGNLVHVIFCPSQVKANIYWEFSCIGILKKAAHKSTIERYFASAGIKVIIVNGSGTTGWGITAHSLIALRSIKNNFPSGTGLGLFTGNTGVLQGDSQGF